MSELNHSLGSDDVIFHTGVSYRHIALLSNEFSSLSTSAPHDITDKSVESYLPHGVNDHEMTKFLSNARAILASSQVNKKRISNGQLPATDIWPWSQGLMPTLPLF